MTSVVLPCLYCSDTERPRTSEHVLQKGFGTNMTLPEDVCTVCNTEVFSPLDHELLRIVRMLIYWDHPDVRVKRTLIQQHGLAFDEEVRVWTTVYIDRNHKPIVSPQLVLVGEGQWAFMADKNRDADWKRRTEQVLGELSRGATLAISKQVITEKLGDGAVPLQTAIVRSAKDTYVVRARDEEHAEQAITAIRSGSFGTLDPAGADPRESESHPWVRQEVGVNIGFIERALTKTALNFVCRVVGPAFARLPAFDPAREFALRPYSEKSAGFVAHLWGKSAEAGARELCEGFAHPGYHSLVVTENPKVGVCVAITLYGRAFALVHLTKPSAQHVLPPETYVGALFDYKASTHTVYSFEKEPEEFCRLFFPGA